jgi:hypothetical protein
MGAFLWDIGVIWARGLDKASRWADGQLPSIPTRLESEMFKEANIEEKEILYIWV